MSKKQEKIVSMFDEIAPSYDKANRVMSLGIDVKWRKVACEKAFEALGRDEIGCVLDVACGTGDMLWHWDKESKK
ncbi:class I SAM-dependent methyltransferase, partial [uncultured Helicobacter sp.]